MLNVFYPIKIIMKSLLKSRLLQIFIAYGTIVGVISVWWSQNSDNVFLLNIPGVIIGDSLYTFCIKVFGDPFSTQAHFSIPWFLRVPQIYVPVSILFWFLLGLLIQYIWTYKGTTPILMWSRFSTLISNGCAYFSVICVNLPFLGSNIRPGFSP